ncbi:MAG TPA: MFS transporter [Anaeromyxobacteraceae bacterium]
MGPPSTASAAAAGRRAGAALALLTLVNLLNYLDRFVVSALVESLRRSELSLSDAQLGSLMTSFILVYMLASPAFGALADRGASRVRILAVGVALWCAATVLSGFARSYGELFLARAAVGVGEAAYGTVAPALLADLYPEERRGRVYSIFFSAIPVGSALGYVLGGLVERALGWRAAFWIAGGPGLLLAAATLLLSDPPRGSREGAAAAPLRGLGWGRLLRNRAYVLAVAGYAAYTAAMGALAFWMPAFLERVRGLPRAQATVVFGTVVVATGFAGTFSGGFVADRLRRRTERANLVVCGLSALAAAPLAVAVFVAPPGPALAALVAALLLLFASTGPVNSAIVAAVAPGERATAMGLSILAIHVLGDVPSPWLVGLASDAWGLGTAVLGTPVAVLIAGAIWTFGARSGARPPGPGRGP